MRKISTKIIAILLCMATLVSSAVIFSSCNKNGKTIVIVENGASSYKIVRPDIANRSIIELASSLHNAISEKCGCDIAMGTDWVKKNRI